MCACKILPLPLPRGLIVDGRKQKHLFMLLQELAPGKQMMESDGDDDTAKGGNYRSPAIASV